MLCEECKTNEAHYAISVMVGNQVTIRHLCEGCASRMHMNLTGSNIRNLLNSILSAITATDQVETVDPENDICCARCGTSLSTFQKTGRLGCPGCYDAFREQLQPMLLQIHGRVQHAGRQPLTTEDAQRSRTRQEAISRQMEQAIALEDFETAAILRDQLRAINAANEGGAAHE